MDEDMIPKVLRVRMPPAPLRTPRIAVDVALGPVVATFVVARPRKGGLDVRPPQTADGLPAIALPPELQVRIAEVLEEAVRGDPETARYLRVPLRVPQVFARGTHAPAPARIAPESGPAPHASP